MPLINTATKIYLGGTVVKKAYLGTTQVWPTPSWTPNDIPGLTLWLDASKQTEADGARVYTVVDYSSVGRTTSFPAGNEPIMRASYGGYPALEWINGYAYGLDCGQWNPGTVGLTWFFVGRRIGGTYPMKIVWGPDADGFEMRSDGSTCQIVLMYTSTGYYYSTGIAESAGDHMWALRVTVPSVSRAWLDSAYVDRSGPTAMPNFNQALYVGRRQGGYPFFGPMREVLVYSGSLSNADVSTIYNYLKSKWGLP